MAAILEIENLAKSFDGVKALDGATLAVPEGEIVSLIGPNGAGKTTLFNVICGFLDANAGTVSYRDRKLNGTPPHRIARLGIGRTFQDLRLIRRITVLENVMLAFQHQSGEGVWHALWGAKAKREEQANYTRALELLEFVGLADKKNDLVEALSYGQQKLVTLACCLAMDAQLLLLDEPVAGIDPEMSRRMLELLGELKAAGKTIFLIEHNMEAVTTISDKVIVMDAGRKIAEGAPAVVMLDAAVLEAYLK
mgnify:CR=1 FL=1